MASGSIDPISQPNAYDFPTFNGQVCPGWAHVRGFKRKWAWDKKQGKGIQGFTLTYTGKQPVEGEIEFFLSEPYDFENWESFRPMFIYDPTLGPAQVVNIKHPFLQDLGTQSFVATDIGQIEHLGENLYSCIIKFAEYVKPPPTAAVSTPTGQAKTPPSQASATPPPAPTDPLQVKIASLYKQLTGP
jgi:hypothetical protein